MAGILLEMIRPVPAGRRLFLVLKSVGMDSLALIECQRITALIESAVEKLGILASLTSGGWNLSLMNIVQLLVTLRLTNDLTRSCKHCLHLHILLLNICSNLDMRK